MSAPTRKPRVFLSRTSTGLKATAARAAEILGERVEVIHQPDFYPSTHAVKGMLAEHLRSCDDVVCLIGPAYGSGPTDPFTRAKMPVRGLKDQRTHDRLFSYTQLEFLIARDLPRHVYTLFIGDGELLADFPPESPDLAARQRAFIADFAKDGSNTYGTKRIPNCDSPCLEVTHPPTFISDSSGKFR